MPILTAEQLKSALQTARKMLPLIRAAHQSRLNKLLKKSELTELQREEIKQIKVLLPKIDRTIFRLRM